MTEEQRVKRNSYMRAYHQSHKTDEKYMADRKKSRATYKENSKGKNRVYNTAYSKAWRAKHPEWRKELRAAGYAKLKGVHVARANYEAVFDRWNGECGICSEPVEGKFHYDHIIPLAKGGPHIEDNIQITHPLCNRKKQDKLPELVGV